MTETTLLQETRGNLTILTLNRPRKLNALDFRTIDLLQAALDEAETNSAIRCVVLTGIGDRAFSAGADIDELAAVIGRGPDEALRAFVRRGQRLTARIESFPKPIIVAVNGIAFGAGCEITEAAPLAIASEHAVFGKPEIRLGFPPPFGGTQRLPRLVGRKRALEMILTAEPIGARTAERYGLVNRVVARERLLAEAVALASRIAAHSAETVTACLASVTRGLNVSIDEGLAIEATQFRRMAAGPDVADGIAAFRARKATRT